MGVVYRARDLALDRVVALKVIAPWLVAEESARRRFVRESRLAAAIEHPHVLPIYSAGERDGVAYIVMRFVSGADLRTLVRERGPLSPSRAARVAANVGGALDAAHRAGLVHRDVKPANILFADGGHVYLSDFGLSRSTSATSGPTQSGQWVGTADYVAPEQIRGEEVDGRADVYALGGVLHFALTGRPPYVRERQEATLWAHLSESPPKARSVRPDVPRALDEVIARAMAKDPGDRYQTAGELGRAALAAVGLEAGSDEATALARGPRASRRGGRRRAVLLGAAALGAAAVAAAVIWGGGDPDRPSTATDRTATPAPSEPQTIPVGRRPEAIAAGGRGRVWLLSGTRTRLVSVSPSGRVDRGPVLNRGGEDLVAASGSLYAAFDDPSRVLRIDERTGRRAAASQQFAGATRRLAVGAGAVWVTERSPRRPEPDHVLKLDAETLATISRTPMDHGARDVRVGAGSVWVASRDRPEVVELDPESLEVRSRTEAGGLPQELAVGAGAVWAASEDGVVSRIDLRNRRRVTIAVGARPSAIELRDDEVWIASLAASSVTRIDARSLRAGEPATTCLNPGGLAITQDEVWVACVGDNSIERIARGAR